MRVLVEEETQQLVDGHQFGDHRQLAFDFPQVRLWQADETEQVFDVDHADALIEMPFDERITGVLVLDGAL